MMTPARKARLKAAIARAKREALIRTLDPRRVYLTDTYWKEATLTYIETGEITGGMPHLMNVAARAATRSAD